MATEIATLGSGCFWCTEAVYDSLNGVLSVESGYMGGRRENPTYEQVCSGATGHVEVVNIEFDPAVISFRDILDVFFAVHDPTTLNRQGNDIGEQYRSVVFYHSDEQRRAAEDKILALEQAKEFPRPIVTAVEPAKPFYRAEAYHQEYFANNPNQPYCSAVVGPKVAKFRKKFAGRLKAAETTM